MHVTVRVWRDLAVEEVKSFQELSEAKRFRIYGSTEYDSTEWQF